jgi:hypothetical protein
MEKDDVNLSWCADKIYALENKPKFKRGEKVTVQEWELMGWTSSNGSCDEQHDWEDYDGTIIRCCGVKHHRYAYDVDLNGERTLLEVSEGNIRKPEEE